MKEQIIISILFLLTFLVVNVVDTYNHEFAHQQIAVYNGCQNGTLKLTLLGGSFKCHSYLNITPEQKENQFVLDSFNEIINYNVGSLNLVVILCSLVISTILINEKCQ